MAENNPGYVYILTNPSFREDWVKIGKSSRPVDVRSKELDNTAVPLPFDIYATMKTVKYNEAEGLVHGLMDQLTDKRIRKNREFFNLRLKNSNYYVCPQPHWTYKGRLLKEIYNETYPAKDRNN